MDQCEKRRRARDRAAHRRLRSPDPRCAICGESDYSCLELHEPGGRKHSNLSGIFCRNCHRKLENARRDRLPPIWTPPDPLERLSKALQGEADLLELLAMKRREDAQMLHDLSAKAAITPEDGDHEAPA
jgi:hypothetical protein